jgi:hypothetical protein
MRNLEESIDRMKSAFLKGYFPVRTPKAGYGMKSDQPVIDAAGTRFYPVSGKF